MQPFHEKILAYDLNLHPLSVQTLQVNITKTCNQACRHCHVDSSPKRREMMSQHHFDQIIRILGDHPRIETLDVTGGAPELHPQFRQLVRAARGLGKKVIVRHNLTVTFDPHPMSAEDMHWIPEFLAENKVELVCSLPYYREYLTDRQRGNGVFQKSIEGLKRLNSLGFGQSPELVLNLVYNPVGHFLPGSQASLEQEYKRELQKSFGIVFHQLFALTNMPIHRFKDDLIRTSHFEEYMEKLHSAFNPTAAAGVMCRSLVSVSWDGKLYDCDFNQMLNMEVGMSLDNFDQEKLLKRKIKLADHCYGCTAGAGSSCGGNTST